MDPGDDLYCEIHVETPPDRRALLDLLAQILAPAARRGPAGLATRELDAELVVNETDRPPGRELPAGEFLRFRYRLEIEPAAGASVEGYKAEIGRLLEALWARGAVAVAGCLFEDELPRRGGIDRR